MHSFIYILPILSGIFFWWCSFLPPELIFLANKGIKFFSRQVFTIFFFILLKTPVRLKQKVLFNLSLKNHPLPPGFLLHGRRFHFPLTGGFLILLFSIQKLTLNTDGLDTVILDNVCFLGEMGHVRQACAWVSIDCRI